jgi:hypothetical protein
MKSLKILLLPGIMLGIALLFSQCRHADEDPQIPYNEENAKVHIISINAASQFVENFTRGKIALDRQLKDTTYLDKNFNMPVAEAFNRDAIAALLNQKGAKGVRIYLGQDQKGLVRLVLVAVDDRGSDIVGSNGRIMKFAGNSQGAIALESGQRCPTLCSVAQPK